jgi:hypothetical protein
MTHLNLILETTARAFISDVCQRTRYRYIFDPQTLVPSIRDTDVLYEVQTYPEIKYFLNDAAGPEYGIQSLRHVLRAALNDVAAEHIKRPKKAVEVFLADLERRSLGAFLSGGGEHDVKRRVAKLRQQLNRLDYRLEKSRRRDPLHPHYGVYDVIHRITHEINLDAPRDLARLERWVEAMLAAQRTTDDEPLVTTL